jgi:hypothetical protein
MNTPIGKANKLPYNFKEGSNNKALIKYETFALAACSLAGWVGSAATLVMCSALPSGFEPGESSGRTALWVALSAVHMHTASAVVCRLTR